MVTSLGVGQYSASGPGEIHQWATSRAYKKDGTRRAVLWLHSAGQLGNEPFVKSDCLPHVLELTEELNAPLIGFDAYPESGGFARHWGNDTGQSRTTDAISYIASALNAKTDRVVLIGCSMGGCLALNYARANPTKVAGLALIYPAVNLQACHDGSGGATNFDSQIVPAYGGTEGAYAAAAPTHDPAQNTAAIAALGMPMKMWYSTADIIVGTSNQTAFATAVGSALQTESLGAVGHMDFTQVSAASLGAFIAGCL